ncbi:MAG: replicative DNA helicase [Candidatus Bipolaricaulota bacterium]|nr:MAG: replicative DNA helicase [Candidatus Bipolaricaulota bacterium]
MIQDERVQLHQPPLREHPRNIEAEQVVLGSAMLEPEGCVPILVEKLRPEHFYQRAHRVVFRTIRDLFDRGEPVDVVSVANRLEETGDMEKVGGRIYLNELLDRVTTTASLEHYSDIVRKKATFRALIEAGGSITELGYDDSRDTNEALDKAETLIFDISSRDGMSTSYRLVSQYLYEHINRLEELHRDPNRHTITGLSTGFPRFDEMTSGLQRSDLIILAGRPGMGKTSLALAIVRHAAIREKAKVAVFSLEMTKEQLLERLLCGEAKVSLHRLRGGYVPAEKWRHLANAASKLQSSTVVVDDTPGISILEIRAKARRIAAQQGLDLVIVDYLQLVEASVRTDVREQEISHISRSLKKLSRELHVPVIAVSQLNRAVEQRERGKRKPRLSDLRESGAIEQDADLVAFIYRPDYYSDEVEATNVPDGARGSGVDAEILVEKQRNGPLGKIPVTFHKAYASFYPRTWEPAPSPSGEQEAPF